MNGSDRRRPQGDAGFSGARAARHERLKAIEAGQQELKNEMKAEFKELRAEMTRQFEKAEVRADTRYHELAKNLHLEERVKTLEQDIQVHRPDSDRGVSYGEK